MCTYWTGVYDCIFFTMNADLYNSLSPELQAIVDECGQKAAQNQRKLEREQDQEVLKKWADAGVTVTELTDEAAAEFKDASSSVADLFVKDALTRALTSLRLSLWLLLSRSKQNLNFLGFKIKSTAV